MQKFALTKLFDPPTVQTSEVVNIVEVNPPLITICVGHQQIYNPYMEDQTLADHLRGVTGNNSMLAWDGYNNMTMIQLIEHWNFVHAYLDVENPKEEIPWREVMNESLVEVIKQWNIENERIPNDVPKVQSQNGEKLVLKRFTFQYLEYVGRLTTMILDSN